ncbi:unnamed protein product [Polarella glacialis]|uniref:Neurotransmitter-gated ion-channel ligand-binding domain-containing protein n=1 Tax=Polarella glacialis TaxID=89957 RepID=A0A813JBR6_POLGL|nr:unnamed protein product [Polarella glacialis]
MAPLRWQLAALLLLLLAGLGVDSAGPPQSGFELRGHKESHLFVTPIWQAFLGFNDARKMVEGKLAISMLYNEDTEAMVSDVRNLVQVVNYASGSSGQTNIGAVTLHATGDNETHKSTTTIYSGNFLQNGFDMTCYPFDEKIVTFEMKLVPPGDIIFELDLSCTTGSESEQSFDPVLKVNFTSQCTTPINHTRVGFYWSAFQCKTMRAQGSTESIVCEIKGERDTLALFKLYMVPSIIYSAMGFASFYMPVEMSMPRVATTMLALLSLSSLRVQLTNSIPSSGAMSFMEEYFLLSIFAMYFNLVGHIVSFYFQKLKRPDLAHFVDNFSRTVCLSIFLIVLACRLYVRDCPNMPQEQASLFVSASVICLVASTLYSIHRYRFAVAAAVLAAVEGLRPSTKEPQAGTVGESVVLPHTEARCNDNNHNKMATISI